MSTDVFAKIGMIGASRRTASKGEIEVLSSWGVSQTGTMSSGGGAGSGKATFHDFVITHHLD